MKRSFKSLERRGDCRTMHIDNSLTQFTGKQGVTEIGSTSFANGR